MAQAGTFWLSGRARRIDHDCNVVSICAFAAFAQQGGESATAFVPQLEKLRITEYPLRASYRSLIECHDASYLGECRTNAQQLLQLGLSVDYHKLSVGVINDVLALFCRTRRI